MKVLKIALLTIALAIVSLFLVISFLPSSAHIERSILVKASPEAVYRELITFRNFYEWFPWIVKNASATYTFSGPEFGPGAVMSWSGDNPDIGGGKMEIVEAEENKKVVTRMRFQDYAASPTATWLINPTDSGTLVTWTYDETHVSGINKIFMLGIDGFLGSDYEAGLEKLKGRIEAAPVFRYAPELNKVSGFLYLGIDATAANDPAMISSIMAQNYGLLMTFISKNQLDVSGHPIAILKDLDEVAVSFTCGVPVDRAPAAGKEDISVHRSYAGLVVEARYKGDYSMIDQVHQEIRQFLEFYNYRQVGYPWETYITKQEGDPVGELDSAGWETVVRYPVE